MSAVHPQLKTTVLPVLPNTAHRLERRDFSSVETGLVTSQYHEVSALRFGWSCRHGLKILVTLYHFVHPAWFDALGHFEKADNIQHFVNYAVTAFRCATWSLRCS